MNIGERVRIEGTGTSFDTKEGILEEIKSDDEGNAVEGIVFVDFIPEENKRVRQNFPLESILPITQEITLGESKKFNRGQISPLKKEKEYSLSSRKKGKLMKAVGIGKVDWKLVEKSNLKNKNGGNMKLREANGNVIKEIDWNGHHYTFTNTFKRSNTKSHDILTMEDENGNEWQGETTWSNRPWHRFDLEEAFDEIVSKAFGPKALKIVQEIDKKAYSVEDVIDKFFAQLKPEDIEENPVEKIDSSIEGRKNALAKYLEVEPSELEEVDENTFEYDGAEYRVLTDDEADDEFDYAVRTFWEDYGLDGVDEYFRDWVLEYAVDSSELEDYVREDISDYYYDLDDEDIADEAINEGLVDAEDVYDEESDEYSPELRDDVDFDDLREQLIEEKLEEVDNYAEYLRDMGFGDDFFKDYIDEEAVIEALKDDADVNGTGRGQELAYYDGNEIELDGGLFAYRTN